MIHNPNKDPFEMKEGAVNTMTAGICKTVPSSRDTGPATSSYGQEKHGEGVGARQEVRDK
jgi:hypothetical protein